MPKTYYFNAAKEENCAMMFGSQVTQISRTLD